MDHQFFVLRTIDSNCAGTHVDMLLAQFDEEDD